MTLDNAIFIFVLFLGMYMVFTEIFTVLFMLTGLSEEKARFQVVSMLTNSGFTTRESELIVASPIRRRLGSYTMLFGYIFSMSIVSAILNVFLSVSQKQLGSIVHSIVYPTIYILALVTVRKLPFIKQRFDGAVKNIASKIIFGKKANIISILDSYGENVIAELIVKTLPDVLEGVTLMNSKIRENYDLRILIIKRDSQTLSNVGPGDFIYQHDRVVIFGALNNIKKLFKID